jgi:hypothetical protein
MKWNRMMNKRTPRKGTKIERQKWYTEGLKKDWPNQTWNSILKDFMTNSLKGALWENTGNLFDKNNYSLDRKSKSLLLYSNTPGNGPLLERYDEIQMPIKYSLKFSSISFQTLLLCLLSNYTYCVLTKMLQTFPLYHRDCALKHLNLFNLIFIILSYEQCEQ